MEIKTTQGVAMRKTCIRVVGILACGISPLCADGFSENDRALIAGKGVFPGPGSDDEGAIPEADMSDDSEDTATKPNTKNSHRSDADVKPHANSNQPSGGKDVSPQARSSTGK
jgi:hypothetical protein